MNTGDGVPSRGGSELHVRRVQELFTDISDAPPTRTHRKTHRDLVDFCSKRSRYAPIRRLRAADRQTEGERQAERGNKKLMKTVLNGDELRETWAHRINRAVCSARTEGLS